jgi:hypothetical protein
VPEISKNIMLLELGIVHSYDASAGNASYGPSVNRQRQNFENDRRFTRVEGRRPRFRESVETDSMSSDTIG